MKGGEGTKGEEDGGKEGWKRGKPLLLLLLLLLLLACMMIKGNLL